jgi:hypothetical protein
MAVVKINGKDLSKHLRVIATDERVKGVSFEKNFEATTVDDSDQVIVHGVSDIEFDGDFGVLDITHLSKMVDSFGDDLEITYDEDSGKLSMVGGGVHVRYQCARSDVAQRKRIKWKSASAKLSEDLVIDATLREGAVKQYTKYRKLIKPQLVEILYRAKELVAVLISEKSHQAEVILGPANSAKKKLPVFKVNADALSAVLNCVPEPTETDQVGICVGRALMIEFGPYCFFVEPLVQPEFEKIEPSPKNTDDF